MAPRPPGTYGAGPVRAVTDARSTARTARRAAVNAGHHALWWWASQSRRLVAAQRVSSLRLDSCSLRSTFEAWDSTVFTEMNSREPISR